MDKIILNLKNFAELTRAYALSITFASCLIIFSYAYYSEKFSFLNFILLTFALCLVHLGANLFDCYIDVKMQLKEGKTFENMVFANKDKARLIRNNTFSFKQVEIILGIMFSVAILIGIYFAHFSDWKVLIFAFFGGILTLFYPISPKYHLSEIIIGLIYGPLMIMGGYYALVQDFNINLLVVSCAIFFATLVLLHTHNIMDWEFDINNNKNTLAILTGSKYNAIVALKWMIAMAYIIITIGVLFLYFNPKMLSVYLTLPIATKLIRSIKEYVEIKDVEFKPRWYWGFFENWEIIKEQKLDFYMFRFYLARNFSLFFAIFATIGAMV